MVNRTDLPTHAVAIYQKPSKQKFKERNAVYTYYEADNEIA